MMTDVDAECKPDNPRPTDGPDPVPRPPAHGNWPRPGAADVLDALADALLRFEADARDEHRPTGPDALREVELHAVLAEGLSAAGIAVSRETPYPFDPGGRVLPRDRERCDLVVLPAGAASVFDPVLDRGQRDAGSGTLFAGEVDRIAAEARPPDACDPEDAAWVEIKTTGTVVYRDGVPTPNRAYADELVRGVLGDAIKLADAPRLGVRCAAAIVFAHDPAAIERDLVTVAHRLLDHGVGTRSPLVRTVPIADRVGNTCCVVGLFEVDASPDVGPELGDTRPHG